MHGQPSVKLWHCVYWKKVWTSVPTRWTYSCLFPKLKLFLDDNKTPRPQ